MLPSELVKDFIPGNIRDAELFLRFIKQIVMYLKVKLQAGRYQVESATPAAFQHAMSKVSVRARGDVTRWTPLSLSLSPSLPPSLPPCSTSSLSAAAVAPSPLPPSCVCVDFTSTSLNLRRDCRPHNRRCTSTRSR